MEKADTVADVSRGVLLEVAKEFLRLGFVEEDIGNFSG